MPENDPDVGSAELEVLKTLWSIAPATVREVMNDLHARGRHVAYTTVLTFLARLEQKGMVKSDKSGVAYVYRPAVTRERVSKSRLENLLSELYDGAAGALVLQLVREQSLTHDEISELQQSDPHPRQGRSEGALRMNSLEIAARLWSVALIVIPLAIGVQLLCRIIPMRPSTRHTLFLSIMLFFVMAPFLPAAPGLSGWRAALSNSESPDAHRARRQTHVARTSRPHPDPRAVADDTTNDASASDAAFHFADPFARVRASDAPPPIRVRRPAIGASVVADRGGTVEDSETGTGWR